MNTIIHLDLDAFFVSVERIFDPSLNGKPVIVGADPKYGRGVVSTCSYEARKYGIHSAMPISKAYKLCPHGIYLHGRHREYSKFSAKVKEILDKYFPVIEQASIDEFYLDFTGCEKIYGKVLPFVTKLQKEIWDSLSLPCSFGIASNRTVAKIASDCMKPRGITYVEPGGEKDFLAPMPLEAIPGVGKVTIKSLHKYGFYKIGDVAKSDEETLGKLFGKYGVILWRKAHGIGRDYIGDNCERKSISKERTYGKDESEISKIEKTLFDLTGKVAQLMRNKNWRTTTVSIKLRYSDFTTITRAKTIHPTGDDEIIFNVARQLFLDNYEKNRKVRLIGVHLTNFQEAEEQEELFETTNVKRKKMFQAVDSIRSKFGFKSLHVGDI